MFDEVNGKPVRGVLSNVLFPAGFNFCFGTLTSSDYCEGEPERYSLGTGEVMCTSDVVSIQVVEGQLVLETLNSAYIVEGSIATKFEQPREEYSFE